MNISFVKILKTNKIGEVAFSGLDNNGSNVDYIIIQSTIKA